MPIIRYISTFAISCILTLLLFIFMQKMLNFEQQKVHKTQSLNGLDFVRLIREPKTEKILYKTKTPEQPKPPEKNEFIGRRHHGQSVRQRTPDHARGPGPPFHDGLHGLGRR